MDKKLLLEKYIKVAVRKALAEQEAKEKRATKSMYLIYRFPGLKKVMENLMSPSFGRFVTNVDITAPKPTTFNIELINGQSFTIRYDGRKNFTAKVSGRKYNIQSLGDLERAQQAIADVLELNYAVDEKEGGAGEAKKDAGAEAFSAATAAPAAEIPAETPPAEETPAPEEEETPAEA